MRRATTMALVAAMLLGLSAGAALAEHNIACTGGLCEGNVLPNRMSGTSGFDDMRGLRGDDELFGDEDNDILDGGDGYDVLDGWDGDDTVFGGDGNDHISATDLPWRNSGDDNIFGGPGSDTVFANDGFEDHIDCGMGDNDFVHYDKDKDSVIGCERRNIDIDCPGGLCQGTTGNDTMRGTSGFDDMRALEGDDELFGWEDNDRFFGGDGNDSLNGGNGDDTAVGLSGDDKLSGEEGNDTLNAGPDNDWIWAVDFSQPSSPRVETVNGGPQNDTVFANDGFEDHIDCGMGDNDIVHYDKDKDSIIGCERRTAYIDCKGGLCQGTNNNDEMSGTSGFDDMGGFSGDDELFGGDGDDKLFGGNGNDRINALESLSGTAQGVDTVNGGPGNDTIAANDGLKDTIDCGTGSRDIAYVDVGDHVNPGCEWRASYRTPRYCSWDFESGAPWMGESDAGELLWVGDKILWCIDGTKGNDKGDKELVGTADWGVVDSIWGDSGDDTLKGGLGADALEGWSGNDILVGAAGTDWLFGDSSENPRFGEPIDGSGNDEIYGQDGNDFIGAIDGKKDKISCGSGHDWVQLDRGLDEVAKDCETIEGKGEDHLWWFRRFGRRR